MTRNGYRRNGFHKNSYTDGHYAGRTYAASASAPVEKPFYFVRIEELQPDRLYRGFIEGIGTTPLPRTEYVLELSFPTDRGAFLAGAYGAGGVAALQDAMRRYTCVRLSETLDARLRHDLQLPLSLAYGMLLNRKRFGETVFEGNIPL